MIRFVSRFNLTRNARTDLLSGLTVAIALPRYDLRRNRSARGCHDLAGR